MVGGSRIGALTFIVLETLRLVVGWPFLGCGGTFDSELVTKLVAENIGVASSAVRLEEGPEGYRFQVVCLARAALQASNYTHVSLAVFHSVNESEAVYGQYDFECDIHGINGLPLVWSAGFREGLLGTQGSDNRQFPLAQSPPRSQNPAVDCVACVNPAHPLGGVRANADPLNHCLREFLSTAPL